MCYVIVTCRSMLWSLLTIMTTLIVVGAIVTPQWLVGRPQWIGLRSEKTNGSVYDHEDKTFHPTIGVFNRCTKVHKFGDFHSDNCATFVEGFDMDPEDFPNTWKSALIFFIVAAILLLITNFTAVFSLCIQAIFKKSIFTVSGLVQSIAGLFLVIGQVLYPTGWGAQRIKNLCGSHSGPFLIDDCQIGWAWFACMGGTFLVFVCALLSIQAENSTSSDKVESKILEGKNVVCIP